MADERRTINDVLIGIAGALMKQFGEGYLDIPVEGLVMAVTIQPTEEGLKKMAEQHPGLGMNPGTAVVGSILGNAPNALAMLLHRSKDEERFTHALATELMVMSLAEKMGRLTGATLQETRLPKNNPSE